MVAWKYGFFFLSYFIACKNKIHFMQSRHVIHYNHSDSCVVAPSSENKSSSGRQFDNVQFRNWSAFPTSHDGYFSAMHFAHAVRYLLLCRITFELFTNKCMSKEWRVGVCLILIRLLSFYDLILFFTWQNMGRKVFSLQRFNIRKTRYFLVLF